MASSLCRTSVAHACNVARIIIDVGKDPGWVPASDKRIHVLYHEECIWDKRLNPVSARVKVLNCLVLLAPFWQQRHASYIDTCPTLNNGRGHEVCQRNALTSHVHCHPTEALKCHGECDRSRDVYSHGVRER